MEAVDGIQGNVILSVTGHLRLVRVPLLPLLPLLPLRRTVPA